MNFPQPITVRPIARPLYTPVFLSSTRYELWRQDNQEALSRYYIALQSAEPDTTTFEAFCRSQFDTERLITRREAIALEDALIEGEYDEYNARLCEFDNEDGVDDDD